MLNLQLKKFFNLCCDIVDVLRRLEAGHHLTLLVDKELGEVPLDVGFLLVVGICLREHVVEDGGNLMAHIPTSKTFLLLQELVEGIGIITVYLDLLEAGELCAEVQLTELMDALVSAGSLLSELVAGEVENLEALAVILLIEFLQLVVLWGESTLGCCIDNQQHLVGVFLQGYVLAFSVLDSEVINCFHFY